MARGFFMKYDKTKPSCLPANLRAHIRALSTQYGFIKFFFPIPKCLLSYFFCNGRNANCKNLVPDLVFSDLAFYKICLGSTLWISVCTPAQRHTGTHTLPKMCLLSLYGYIYFLFWWMKGCQIDDNFVKNDAISTKDFLSLVKNR